MPTRLQIAKADIVRHFDDLPKRVLRKSDIARELSNQRSFWRLAQRTNADSLTDFLRRHGRLHRHQIDFPGRASELFTWGDDVPRLEILQSLRPRSYFSHYTAIRLHGLTEQDPKTIYITEHPVNSERRHTPLTQDSIDAAFKRPPRITQQVGTSGDIRVCIVNGSSNSGVVDFEMREGSSRPFSVQVTGIERTLIDATVRPAYCGGVAEVLRAFENARNKMSANRMRALLQKMEYLYPYHQAIGFYLERAGFTESALKLFAELPQSFDFYLSHDLGATDYVKRWRLHIPRGL